MVLCRARGSPPNTYTLGSQGGEKKIYGVTLKNLFWLVEVILSVTIFKPDNLKNKFQ